jgi:hypothetical protein
LLSSDGANQVEEQHAAACTLRELQYVDEVVDENLKCAICTSPFLDPLTTPCEHSFCQVRVTLSFLNSWSPQSCWAGVRVSPD